MPVPPRLREMRREKQIQPPPLKTLSFEASLRSVLHTERRDERLSVVATDVEVHDHSLEARARQNEYRTEIIGGELVLSAIRNEVIDTIAQLELGEASRVLAQELYENFDQLPQEQQTNEQYRKDANDAKTNRRNPLYFLASGEFTDPAIIARAQVLLLDAPYLFFGDYIITETEKEDLEKHRLTLFPGGLSLAEEEKARELSGRIQFYFMTKLDKAISEEKVKEVERETALQLIYKDTEHTQLREGVMLQSVQGDMAAGKTTTLEKLDYPKNSIVETGNISRATPGTPEEVWSEVMQIAQFGVNNSMLLPNKFIRLVAMKEIQSRRMLLDKRGFEDMAMSISGFPRTEPQANLIEQIVDILHGIDEDINTRVKAVNILIEKDHSLERIIGRMIHDIHYHGHPRGDDSYEVEYNPETATTKIGAIENRANNAVEAINHLLKLAIDREKENFNIDVFIPAAVTYLVNQAQFHFKQKDPSKPDSTRYDSLRKGMVDVTKVLAKFGIDVREIPVDRSMTIGEVAHLLRELLTNPS